MNITFRELQRGLTAERLKQIVCQGEIIITSDGSPIAKIVPVNYAAPEKQIDTQSDISPVIKPYLQGRRYSPGEPVRAEGKIVKAPELDSDGNPIPDY